MNRRSAAEMRRWRNLQPFPGREFLGEAPTAPSSRRAWQEVGKGAVLVSQAGRGHESINIPSESALCSPATGCQGSSWARGHPVPEGVGMETHLVLFFPFHC